MKSGYDIYMRVSYMRYFSSADIFLIKSDFSKYVALDVLTKFINILKQMFSRMTTILVTRTLVPRRLPGQPLPKSRGRIRRTLWLRTRVTRPIQRWDIRIPRRHHSLPQLKLLWTPRHCLLLDLLFVEAQSPMSGYASCARGKARRAASTTERPSISRTSLW